MKEKLLTIFLFLTYFVQNSAAGIVVGKISDSYDVTPNGQFHYEMPVSVASGTGGMSPHLSIVYDSSKGDGLLGYGFDFSGISLISRAPRNLYRDGKADVIRFDGNDRFMLDGMRLTLVSTTASQREYRTENNTFARIAAEGDKNNPSRFIVHTKDGITREFTNAKTLNGISGNSLYWLETKVSDTKGNYYTISYGSDPEYNEFWPLRIDYTGNEGAGLAPFASVSFSYTTSNSSVSYISGIKTRRSHAIKSIICKYGESTVRKYDIEYFNTNNILKIKSITESTDRDSKRLTIFNWNDNIPGGTVYAGTLTYSGATQANVITGDFNGDGKTDILVRPIYSDRLEYQVYLSNGNSFVKACDSSFSIVEKEGKTGKYIENVVSGDFNGDGYDDIVVERGNHPFYLIDLYLSNVDGNGNYSLSYETTIVRSLNSKHVMYATDINCDGAADLIVRGGYTSSDYCMLISESSENGIKPLVRQSDRETLPGSNTWNNVYLVDLDGDGTVEMLNMCKDNYCIMYEIEPNGKLNPKKKFTFGTGYFCMGDFNADGKTDVITMGTDKDPSVNWEMNFSTGLVGENVTSFVYEPIIALFNPKEKQIYVADINGDGYDDIYAISKKTSSGKAVATDIYINDRTGKAFTHYTGSSTLGTDKRNFRIADFNGDGKADFVCYPNSKNASLPIDLHLSGCRGDNMLSRITDGIGNTTEIAFSQLTDKSVHERGNTSSYPIVSACCQWPVVKSVSTPDGIGGRYTVGYKYYNLLLHRRGRGILGFEKVAATDFSTGTVTEKGYETIKDEALPALQYTRKLLDGVLLNETYYKNVINYQYRNGQAEVSYTSFPECVEEKSYEYNTGEIVSHKLTSYEYDSFGNCLKTTVTSGENSVVTENEYKNDEGRWILGRLAKSSVTKSGKNETITLKSEFKYDEESGLLTEEAFEPDDADGYRKRYTYDTFGNIVSDVTVPNDGRYDSRSTETAYDAQGRFVASRKNEMSFTDTSETDPKLGVETKSVDSNGFVTNYTHDSFGTTTNAYTPIEHVKMTTEWSDGNIHAPQNSVYFTKTDKTGYPAVMEFYDCLGRTLRKVSEGVDGRMVYTDAVYDGKGRLVASSEPYFQNEVPVWTHYEYDAVGRKVKTIKPDGGTVSMGYSGLVCSVTDANGNTSEKEYDMDGNLVRSTDAMGGSVSYKYNTCGTCIEVSGPRTVTKIEYDKYGNRTKLVDPDLGTIEYTYTPYGELATQRDLEGTTSYEYDKLGRVTKEKRQDFTYTYIYDTDWKGALSESECSNGIRRKTCYDQYGRISSVTETVCDKDYVTRNTYDGLNHLVSIEYPSGIRVRNSYTDNGYLVSVSSEDDGKTFWTAGERNAMGKTLADTFGNGVTVKNTYDMFGRLSNVQSDGLFSKSYVYDFNGNLACRSDGLRSMTECFGYDALDRLISVSDNVGHNQTMKYDNAGNLTYKTGLGSVSYVTGTNRIGSVKGETFALPAFDNVVYTSFNKICSLRRNTSENPLHYYDLSIDYGVDKEKKTETTSYFMGGCGQNFDSHYRDVKTRIYVNELYNEEIAKGTEKNVNYIYADGKPVAIYEVTDGTDGKTLYIHHDNLGSVMAYSNEDGILCEELSYDAWGRRRKTDTWDYFTLSNDSISEHDAGFTGHDHIDMFDLVNMDGRMYDPLTGRFMSPDPIVQMPEYTQSLNRYAYCMNNPLSLTDPTGYSWIGDTFSAIVGIAVGLETGGLAYGVYGAVIGGMAGGASSALVNSLINGANLMQTAKNTFTGGFWGGVSGLANFEIGNLENVYMKIAAHSVSEGAMEGIRGGHFEHGFFVGMASAAGGAALNGGMCDRLSAAERIAVNAVLGGIVSELGGGKFASGAMTAAYVMMFNELKHLGPTYKQIEKIYNTETESISELSPKDFYQSLGGEIAQKAEEGNWENACAARLSYAMNKNGLKIPYIKGITLKDKFGRNYFTLASDMIKYFTKIWGEGIVCNNKYVALRNGITGQSGFTNASGHVDVVYNGKAAGGEHGAVYYYNEGAHTLIWKYGGNR